MVGALTAGALSDRLGRRRGYRYLLVGRITADGRIPGGPWRSRPYFLILLALGFSVLSMMPVLMAMMQEQFPENRALANGIFLGFSFVIQAIATVFLGLLGDRFGLRPAYIFAAIIPLVGLPWSCCCRKGSSAQSCEARTCWWMMR